jgi:hypothetical protein
MNRLCTAMMAALVAAAGAVPLRAAPPTVTPSPGYDARLQEQHKAAASTTTGDHTARPPSTPAPRHHTRRKH